MGIILEGADNSGKTTLSKDLRQLEPRLEYLHAGGRPHNEVHENICLEQQFTVAAKAHGLVDRITSISEQVYRPGRLFEQKLMLHIDNLLQVGAIIVYCRPSVDRLMSHENLTWREEETESFKQEIISNLHRYIENYEQVMTRVPHIHYNYEEEMEAAWLRKMLAESAFNPVMYYRLRDVMFRGAHVFSKR